MADRNETAGKRLLAIPGVRPFIVQNLGKYERQLWQTQQFQGSATVPVAESGVPPDSSFPQTSPGNKFEERSFRRDARSPESSFAAEARQRDYVHFILGLYQAKPLNGYSWLHGTKGGRVVHVGAVDAPVKHNCDAPGEYTVVVKVIDILGNNTTKTVKVKVK